MSTVMRAPHTEDAGSFTSDLWGTAYSDGMWESCRMQEFRPLYSLSNAGHANFHLPAQTGRYIYDLSDIEVRAVIRIKKEGGPGDNLEDNEMVSSFS